jgi:FtsZ-binding cell division protein ZapB
MRVSDSENLRRLTLVGGTETEPVVLTPEQAKQAMKALQKYAEFPFLADHAKQLYESHEALAERVSELERAAQGCIDLIDIVQAETQEAHQTARLLGQAVFDEARKIVALTQSIAAHQAEAARWRARVNGGIVMMPCTAANLPVPVEGKSSE